MFMTPLIRQRFRTSADAGGEGTRCRKHEGGLNIKYQKFALPREGELVEPDIEIPLDDYRSYRRDKRSSKDTAK